MPAEPEEVCSYLYGKNWKKPLKKRTEYYIAIFNNKPLTLYGFSGRVAYKLISLVNDFKNFIRSSFKVKRK